VRKGSVFTDGGLVLQAAVQGEGIALMDKLFVQSDLKAGRLIQPSELSISHGAYWLVARNFTELPEAAKAFVQWLVRHLNGNPPSDKS
jgi:LysR family glycine cleavage system transcriptional activator